MENFKKFLYRNQRANNAKIFVLTNCITASSDVFNKVSNSFIIEIVVNGKNGAMRSSLIFTGLNARCLMALSIFNNRCCMSFSTTFDVACIRNICCTLSVRISRIKKNYVPKVITCKLNASNTQK